MPKQKGINKNHPELYFSQLRAGKARKRFEIKNDEIYNLKNYHYFSDILEYIHLK